MIAAGRTICLKQFPLSRYPSLTSLAPPPDSFGVFLSTLLRVYNSVRIPLCLAISPCATHCAPPRLWWRGVPRGTLWHQISQEIFNGTRFEGYPPDCLSPFLRACVHGLSGVLSPGSGARVSPPPQLLISRYPHRGPCTYRGRFQRLFFFPSSGWTPAALGSSGISLFLALGPFLERAQRASAAFARDGSVNARPPVSQAATVVRRPCFSIPVWHSSWIAHIASEMGVIDAA